MTGLNWNRRTETPRYFFGFRGASRASKIDSPVRVYFDLSKKKKKTKR